VIAAIGTFTVGNAAPASVRLPSPAPGRSAGPAARPWTAQDTARFWTPRRMAQARPLPQPGQRTDGREDASAPGAPSPVSTPFGGVPTIGRMYLMRGGGSYFCTASVVASARHDLVATAAHCLDRAERGAPIAFVPQWTKAKPQPYGIFPVAQDSAGHGRIWIDARYYAEGRVEGDRWDVAFAELGAGSNGTRVQDAVGANTLVTGGPYAYRQVRLIGYSGSAPQPLTCTDTTTKFTPGDVPGSFLRIACTGYSTGSSGSPFLVHVNTATQTGDLVGLIGGWANGGPTADFSYSSYFGNDIRRLYDGAVAGLAAVRP
jgi:V8-like Glu-specific endopeptidase